MARVFIVGGGFGGVYAALELLRIGGHEITLFEPRERFEFTPLLHEVAGGVLTRDDVSIAYDRLLPGVIHSKHAVTHIDLQRRTITAAGTQHTYDAIILAPGSRTNFFGKKHRNVHELKTYSDAIAIRRSFVNNCATAAQERDHGLTPTESLLHAVVIGGGATGVELAGELADLARTLEKEDGVHAHITLIHPRDRLLHQLEEYFGTVASQELKRKGVAIVLNTRVTDINDTSITTTTGVLESACIVWAAGVTPNAIAPLPSPIIVTNALHLANHPEVYAIGDAAVIEGQAPLQRAQLATKQGQTAAQNVAHVLRGETPEPFVWNDQGMIVSLGQKKAVGIIKRRRIRGFAAWVIMRTIYLFKFKNIRQECRTAWTYTRRLFVR